MSVHKRAWSVWGGNKVSILLPWISLEWINLGRLTPHWVFLSGFRWIQNGTWQLSKWLTAAPCICPNCYHCSCPTFLPTDHSYLQVACMREKNWYICCWILPAWKKNRRLAVKQAVCLTWRCCFLFFLLFCPDSKWRAHWNLPKTCITRTYHLCIWLADFHWPTHVFQPTHRSRVQHTEQSAFSVTNLPSGSWHHRGKAHKQASGSSKTLQTSRSRRNLTCSMAWHCLVKNPLLLPAILS